MLKRTGVELSSIITKRKRKSTHVSVSFAPSQDSAPSIAPVRTWTFRPSRRGNRKLGSRLNPDLLLADPEPPASRPSEDISVEDPSAADFAEWENMQDESVVQVGKRKRGQRNDSVCSSCFLR